jgi:hypothetical protein
MELQGDGPPVAGACRNGEMSLDTEAIEADAQGEREPGREAVAAWVERGLANPLQRWLDRVLDPEGVPRILPVREWARLLGRLDEARRRRSQGWPETIDARIEGLLRATLRFARPDGAGVFAPPGAGPGVPELYRGWADRLADAGLSTVVDWWFPRRSRSRARPRSYSSPPLPAWSSPDRPLAMLRANWSGQGDFLAIDQRARGETSLVELCGIGRTWLGPTWVADHGPEAEDAPATPARPSSWVSNPSADLAEWTFRLGALRVTRTALLLRGRRIALLADQVEGRADRIGMRVALPDGVEAAPIAEGRGSALELRRGRQSARVIPLALPCHSGLTGRGTFAQEGGQLRLSQRHEGRRGWLPLLASWDPLRNRRTIHWRTLTVAENSRTCPAEAAFAARVTWGRGETLLIYRSLAAPALRSFLGHQTRARFLVALFTKEGNVVPILKVD